MRNLITDVPGVNIGHAEDARLGSGATAVVFDEPVVGSIDLRGGGPGTRETALLDPAQTVEGIDAIALSGGSAFGLDAASGVQAWLQGTGPRLCGAHRTRADRARSHPVRFAERRRQGLGPFSALSRARLCGGRRGRSRFCPRQRRRRHRRDHGQLQGRDRLRLRADLGRPPRRRNRCRQRRRQRSRRSRPLVLGGAVRAKQRIRRPRVALAVSSRGASNRSPKAVRARARPS